MGQGQMSLTKIAIVVDPTVNVRNFSDVLDALRKNFDPAEDFHFDSRHRPGHPGFHQFQNESGKQDDFGRHGRKKARCPPSPLRPRGRLPTGEIVDSRNLRDSLLVVKVKGAGRPGDRAVGSRSRVRWVFPSSRR
jgi:hypothetical protein